MKIVIRGQENRRIMDLPVLTVFQRTIGSQIYLKVRDGTVSLESGQYDLDAQYGSDRVRVVHGKLTLEEK